MPSSQDIDVLIPLQGESWAELSRRLLECEREVVLVIGSSDHAILASEQDREACMALCEKLRSRVRVATRIAPLVRELRGRGVRVIDRTSHLQSILGEHPRAPEALRSLQPAVWSRQITGRLQRMGLLSLPRVRILSLCVLSMGLFAVVVFRLLPSAEIRITPRQQTVSQTTNVVLAQSGAHLPDLSQRAKVMPLLPLVVDVERVMNVDHISKEFIGTAATVQLTIQNHASERYALREGTRFTNQGGMVFRIVSHAIIEPGEEVTVRAVAEDVDLYSEIIGARGNVPEGLRWDIPGLAPEERQLVYAENKAPATGGTTAYRSVLKQEDLDIAQKRLEQELLAEATTIARQRIDEWNVRENGKHYDVVSMNHPELTGVSYGTFTLPDELLGQEVDAVELAGSLRFSVYAYDRQAIAELLSKELQNHVRDGRKLLPDDSISDHLDVRVIQYDDDLAWVKITADLSAIEEYSLDPLSPSGALFAKSVRESVVDLPRDEALRVIKNMPEVERVQIIQWPPWQKRLPHIPSHIALVTE